jgi:hypothetical protein
MSCLFGFTKYRRNGKLVALDWNWEQCKHDVKAHWHSWYLRNIGLPLLERRLKRIAHTGIQMIDRAEKYVPKSKWTPSPELIAIIQNMNTGHDHESLFDKRY